MCLRRGKQILVVIATSDLRKNFDINVLLIRICVNVAAAFHHGPMANGRITQVTEEISRQDKATGIVLVAVWICQNTKLLARTIQRQDNWDCLCQLIC